MGKKHKKKKHGKKHKLQYKTRAELLLSRYPEELLEIWFNNDEEKIDDFGKWLVNQEEYFSEDALDSICDDDSDYYDDKIRNLRCKKCESMNDMMMRLYDLTELEKEARKGKKLKKKLRKKDLGLATYMDSSRYRKSYLNNDEYRKCLKAIAKQESQEEKEMRKLGYIRSPDPDDELKKLQKANKLMNDALSDSYIQKHFINN